MHKIIERKNFDRWLVSALGSYLCNLESKWLSTCLSEESGNEVVILGSVNAITHANVDFLTKSHVTIIKDSLEDNGNIWANYHALPLLNESIDIVIMPHILDSYHLPLEILSEVYRILKPEGKLYLSCFNKLSIWGLYQIWGKFFNKIPWGCHFTTFLQIEYWLGELGFDIISSKSAGYYLPFNFDKLIALQAIIDKISPTVSLPFGAINLLEVSKRVTSLTLQMPLINAKLIKEFGANVN